MLSLWVLIPMRLNLNFFSVTPLVLSEISLLATGGHTVSELHTAAMYGKQEGKDQTQLKSG